MRVEHRSVTPQAAAELLKSNYFKNRRIRSSWVDQLASCMKNGQWKPSNDAICVTPIGELLNGQHRLSAIVRSGATIDLLFIFDMPEEAFLHMDRGANRSVADVTGLTTLIVADIALIYIIQNKLSRSPRMPEETVLDMADWWAPAHQVTRGGEATAKVGIENAGARVGVGLLWAIEPSYLKREFLLQQYFAAANGDTQSMSKATALWWKKMVQMARGGGKLEQRLATTAFTFQMMNPSKPDIGTRPLKLESVLDEMREHLSKMEEAFANGGGDHPYAWNLTREKARARIRVGRAKAVENFSAEK